MSLDSGGLKKERIGWLISGGGRGGVNCLTLMLENWCHLGEISVLPCCQRELLNSLPCQRLTQPHLTPQDSRDLCSAWPFISCAFDFATCPCLTPLFFSFNLKCTHPEDVRLCTMIVKSNGSFPVNKKKVVSASLFFKQSFKAHFQSC